MPANAASQTRSDRPGRRRGELARSPTASHLRRRPHGLAPRAPREPREEERSTDLHREQQQRVVARVGAREWRDVQRLVDAARQATTDELGGEQQETEGGDTAPPEDRKRLHKTE